MVSLTVFARSDSDAAITLSLARVYGDYTLLPCVSLQATPNAFIISRKKFLLREVCHEQMYVGCAVRTVM